MKMKPVWSDINPKAVTTDELFGYLHPATREWKDGEFFRPPEAKFRKHSMMQRSKSTCEN